MAALLSRYGTSDEVRNAVLDTAIPIEDEVLDGEGRVSMMDAYNELVDDGPHSSREFRPTATWGCVAVIIDAPYFETVTLSMSDGTEQTFTGTFSGEVLFAYSGFQRRENGEYVDAVDEEYEGFHGVIEHATVSNSDSTVVLENANSGCPDDINISCTNVTLEGTSALSGLRVEFHGGGWKEYPYAQFGNDITFQSPGRVLASVRIDGPLTEDGEEPLGVFTVSDIYMRHSDCETGDRATEISCDEVRIGEEETRSGVINGTVTLEFQDGTSQTLQNENMGFELPATITGSAEHEGKEISAVEINRHEWGSTFYFPNVTPDQCNS
jgi:hypothetical protein